MGEVLRDEILGFLQSTLCITYIRNIPDVIDACDFIQQVLSTKFASSHELTAAQPANPFIMPH